MSVAFDAASAVTDVGGLSNSTQSFTHTPTGTPSVVTLNVTYANDINNTQSLSVAGITYGGVAMVFIGGLAGGSEKWILVSPPTGAQTVAVTWIDTGEGTDNVIARATATTFTSTNIPTYGTIQQATGSVSPITKAVANVLSTSMLDTHGATKPGGSSFPTVTVNGTSETKRSGVTNFSDTSPHGRSQHYTSTQTGSGTVTANATESANRPWRIQSVELQEGIVHLLALMGVGL